jgi:seryl-tRNA synthetase
VARSLNHDPSFNEYLMNTCLALNVRRKELVKEQQGALAQRKTLSAEIGKLMREKKVRAMRNGKNGNGMGWEKIH